MFKPNTYTRLPAKNRSIHFQILKSRLLRILISRPDLPDHAPRAHTLNCLVCGKETEPAKADLCPAHKRALDSVKQAFNVWTHAYGNVNLPDFLKRVGKLPGTGQKAKEIVQFLRRNPSRWK